MMPTNGFIRKRDNRNLMLANCDTWMVMLMEIWDGSELRLKLCAISICPLEAFHGWMSTK